MYELLTVIEGGGYHLKESSCGLWTFVRCPDAPADYDNGSCGIAVYGYRVSPEGGKLSAWDIDDFKSNVLGSAISGNEDAPCYTETICTIETVPVNKELADYLYQLYHYLYVDPGPNGSITYPVTTPNTVNYFPSYSAGPCAGQSFLQTIPCHRRTNPYYHCLSLNGTRFMNSHFGSLSFLICLLMNATPLSAQEKSAEEIFQIAATVPGKINRGEFVIKSHYQRFDNLKKDLKTTFRMIFDDKKLRVDREEEGGRLTISCVPDENDGQVFFYESEPKNLIRKESQFANLPEPDFSSLLLYLKKDYVKLAVSEFSEDKYLPNVRSMGFVPCSLTSQAIPYPDISEYFRPLFESDSSDLPQPPSFTLGQENFMGSECISIVFFSDNKNSVINEMLRVKNKGVIKFYGEDGVQLAPNPSSDDDFLKSMQDADFRNQRKFLFDPTKDYALRYEENPSSLLNDKRSIQNDLSQDAVSGLWYPSHWVFERYAQGEIVEREENFLEVISINQPIPPKNFDLSSVKELIPGTTVRWMVDSPPPAEGKLVWDGKKVVGISDYNFAIATAGSWSSRRLFMICVNTAGISAIIAIICLRAWRRQQRMR